MDHLNQIFQAATKIVANPWFSAIGLIVGLIIGIGGIGLSYLFFAKGNKERIPRYAIGSNNIIRDAHELIPDLTVRYAGYGEQLKNFTVSRIALWNAGRETIRKTDVAKAAPIKIDMREGCLLLGLEILYHNPVNGFQCETHRERTSADITFAFMDKDQGIVLQVAHTGISSADLAISGTIMGARNISRRIPVSHRIIHVALPIFRRRSLLRLFFICTGAALMAWSIMLPFRPDLRDSVPLAGGIMGCNGFIYFLLGIVMRRRLVPRELAQAYERG